MNLNPISKDELRKLIETDSLNHKGQEIYEECRIVVALLKNDIVKSLRNQLRKSIGVSSS